MRVRRHIFPRRWNDWFCFLLIAIALPLVFLFEISAVLPAVHEPDTFLYWLTYILACFILHNVVGNFIYCLVTDTSVNFEKLNSLRVEETQNWSTCEACSKKVPPRAWHCKICETCILKRDHHCVFLGCCIGHRNHRYFMLFLVYLFIGSTYAFVYNSIYIWVIKYDVYVNLLTPLKVICPILFFLVGNSWQNMYLVAYSLNVLALLYSVVLSIYHMPIILKGSTSYESDKNINQIHDIGRIENLKRVFGKRFKIISISPLIHSEQPNDGIIWPELHKKQ